MVTGVQEFVGEEVLRGFGAPVAKSAALFSVSVQPLLPRRSAVVLLGAGAALPSMQVVPVPKPRKSTIVPPNGQPEPVSSVVLLTSATLPAVADMAIEPVAFGVGRF